MFSRTKSTATSGQVAQQKTSNVDDEGRRDEIDELGGMSVEELNRAIIELYRQTPDVRCPFERG